MTLRLENHQSRCPYQQGSQEEIEDESTTWTTSINVDVLSNNESRYDNTSTVVPPNSIPHNGFSKNTAEPQQLLTLKSRRWKKNGGMQN